MKNKKTNLPNVWNKPKTENIPEGALWFNPDDPEKLRGLKNGKWEEIDPFEDLEERSELCRCFSSNSTPRSNVSTKAATSSKVCLLATILDNKPLFSAVSDVVLFCFCIIDLLIEAMSIISAGIASIASLISAS